jgi:parallel beta-helix repeat protein
MAPTADKVIVECPNCRQSLWIPANRRRLRLTCPKCRANWLWLSENEDAIHDFEVRPKAKRNAVIVAVLSGLFTSGGLWMLFSGQEVLPALLGTAFGVVGLSAVPKIWRREVSTILTQRGLEQRYGMAILSNNHTITGNAVSRNYLGILVQNPNNNIVEGNRLTNNLASGITVDGTSSGNGIGFNLATGNGPDLQGQGDFTRNRWAYNAFNTASLVCIH